MTTIPTMLTIKEAAQQTKLTEHYIRSLCISGKIVTVKTGKKYLVNLERLIDFLNTGDCETSQCINGIRQVNLR